MLFLFTFYHLYKISKENRPIWILIKKNLENNLKRNYRLKKSLMIILF